MIKQLVSFGCGWTYGDELIDPNLKNYGLETDAWHNNKYREANSYPGQTAEHFGWKHKCLATPKASLRSTMLDVIQWSENTSEDKIKESILVVGLTAESDSLTDYKECVCAIDDLSTRFNIPVIQLNVLAQTHKPRLPTLYNKGVSMMEKIVLQNKPRKDPLFKQYKHPNEKGHKIISEHLIKTINSVIISE